MLFDGFLKVYSRCRRTMRRTDWLPDMEKGEVLQGCRGRRSQQNFTQPPARFTEASLVKDLEEKDIGRPSTYAPIVATLTRQKIYFERKKIIDSYGTGVYSN